MDVSFLLSFGAAALDFIGVTFALCEEAKVPVVVRGVRRARTSDFPAVLPFERFVTVLPSLWAYLLGQGSVKSLRGSFPW